MAERLLIIGAGMATAYLLQELAGQQHDLDITVVGEEIDACYNRVLLSAVLAGDSSESDLQMLAGSSQFAAVNFVTGTRVESVDLAASTVFTGKGQSLGYDKLVFATGASVACPELADTGVRGVEKLRALDDARYLRSLAGEGGAVVVVGGGLLGLEAAHGLNALGFEVSVVHRSAHLMNRQLDEEGARALQGKLERSGIHFNLAATVAGLQADDRQGGRQLTAVELSNGDVLPCGVLVFATGIIPNAQLAAQAGLLTDRGVKVDAYMQCSAPNIFALGECSQFGEHCFGLVAPIREQARVLARRLCAIDGPEFVVEDSPTQLKISGIEIYSAGALHAVGDELVLRDTGAGVYRRLVLRDGRLVSAVLVGDKRGGNWYSELIRSQADVSKLRAGLMFGREVSVSLQSAAQAA